MVGDIQIYIRRVGDQSEPPQIYLENTLPLKKIKIKFLSSVFIGSVVELRWAYTVLLDQSKAFLVIIEGMIWLSP